LSNAYVFLHKVWIESSTCYNSFLDETKPKLGTLCLCKQIFSPGSPSHAHWRTQKS